MPSRALLRGGTARAPLRAGWMPLNRPRDARPPLAARPRPAAAMKKFGGLGKFKNAVETALGVDLDGDGKVGDKPVLRK
eukprot:gene1871-17580_t